MAVPWFTVGTLVLSNLDAIMRVVRPAFTRKKLAEAPDRNALLDQQIAELQAAAAANAEQIGQLAEQLREVVSVLGRAGAEAAADRAASRRMARVALVVAGLSLATSLGLLWKVFGGNP